MKIFVSGRTIWRDYERRGKNYSLRSRCF